MASASSSAGGAAKISNPEIDDMLAHLDLRDDELEDVVIGAEEVKEFQKEARWLAIGTVHTSRAFSADALFGKMKAIWNLSRDPICREAGENIFIFQMHCLGDWKKVVHQGPWTFRGWAVLIEDYDGKTDPEKFEFIGLYVWAQIHGIPELYRKEGVVDDLARRVGKIKEVQMNPKLFFEGNYVRIRVLVEINKPLKRVVTLNVEGEGKKRLFIKYEKVPFFCKRCGLIGHNHEECGDGVWGTKDLQYGDFMLAVRRLTTPFPEARPFAGRGRGSWPGRGAPQFTARKRNSLEADLDNADDLKDDATSPMKTAPSDVQNLVEEVTDAKRNLDFNSESTDAAMAQAPIESVNPVDIPPPPPPYMDPRDRSKLRKTTSSNSDLATSAASSEGDRRAQ